MPGSPEHEAMVSLEAMANSLKTFTEDLRAARGKSIMDFRQKQVLADRIENARTATRQLPPLGALLNGVEAVVNRFQAKDWRNGMEAARWCADHGLIPQAYTLLQETLFSMVLEEAHFPYDVEKWRYAAAYALFSAAKKEDGADFDAQNDDHRNGFKQIQKIVNRYPPGLIQACAALRDYRNDINHGGYLSDAAPAQRLLTRVKGLLDKIEGALRAKEGSLACPSRLPLVFSHRLTAEQERDARERWGVAEFLYLPEELQQVWSRLSPEGELPAEALRRVVHWAVENSSPDGPVLVQGDFGATAFAVRRLQEAGRVPVYATTLREAEESHEPDGTVRIEHTFKHVAFREYPS